MPRRTASRKARPGEGQKDRGTPWQNHRIRFTSHVPAIGAALDLGKTQEPYWKPLFKGYDFSRQWMKDNKPDVIFLVYNDHATAFSLEMIPTFAIGTAAQLPARPTKAGARARCRWSGPPELARTSRNR